MTTDLPATGFKKWTKEGFRGAALRAPATQPPFLDQGQVSELSQSERWDWLDACHNWHANIPALPIPRYENLKKVLHRRVDTSRQLDASVKNGLIIDAPASIGKTRTTLDFLYAYYRRITRNGSITHLSNGNEFVPAIFTSLSEKTLAKGMNKDIHRFMHIPPTSGTAEDIGIAAAERAIDCGVRVVVVDDYHFLASKHSVHHDMGNHIKFLMSIIPAVFILIGVDVEDGGLLNEGLPVGPDDTQSGRRFPVHRMTPFDLASDPEEDDWWTLLASLEDRLLLPGKYPGMLSDDLHDYLYERTQGLIGGLIELLTEGCWQALETGANVLTQEVLDSIDINYIAEVKSGRRQSARA